MANDSSTFLYTAGFNHVGSYQVSCEPWMSASVTVPANSSEPLEISFPRVSKFVIVLNETGSSGDIRLGFSADGVKGTINNNFTRISGSQSFSADYRVTSIFLRSDTASEQTASIIAGLTTIPPRDFNNWSGSSGVG